MQDIKEHETLVLSGRDSQVFYSLVANPPEPNRNLVNLMKDHSQE